MKSNDERKIKIIAGIDDDILEKCIQVYILLSRRQKQKRLPAWVPWASMVACVCIVMGTIFAIFLLNPSSGKQIPIYKGMTMSITNPLAKDDTVENIPDYTFVENKSPATSPQFSLLGEKNADAPSDLDPTSDIYYVQKNQDFYITVHLSNPDNFEILSFTLNGVKYSSYMFEEGSDMEHLVLKCNVGDAEGLVEYTIDAIKYVNDSRIKNVHMEGNRTIQIYVPTPSLSYVNQNFEPIDCIGAEENRYLMVQWAKTSEYHLDSATFQVPSDPTDLIIDEWTHIGDGKFVCCTLPPSHDANCPYGHTKIDDVGNYHSLYLQQVEVSSPQFSHTFDYESTLLGASCYVYDDVKLISSPEDLMDLSGNYLYQMTNDIDLAGINWTPVVQNGYFNGNGYTIHNLSISGKDISMTVGLFSQNEGVINNLHLSNSKIEMTISKALSDEFIPSHIGILVGLNRGTIQRCSIDSSCQMIITFTKSHHDYNCLGTIAGHSEGGIVKNCLFAGDVTVSNAKLLTDMTTFTLLSGISNASNSQVIHCLNVGTFNEISVTISFIHNTSNISSCVYSGPHKVKETYSFLYFGEGSVTENLYHLSQDDIKNVNSKSFWVDTLGWDEEIWCFDDLDYRSGKLPTLRK